MHVPMIAVCAVQDPDNLDAYRTYTPDDLGVKRQAAERDAGRLRVDVDLSEARRSPLSAYAVRVLNAFQGGEVRVPVHARRTRRR